MTESRSPTARQEAALVNWRGGGERSWASHLTDSRCRLRSVPAGLECSLDDAWHECDRQGRSALLLLAHTDEAAERGAALAANAAMAAGFEPHRLDVEAWAPKLSLHDWAGRSRNRAGTGPAPPAAERDRATLYLIAATHERDELIAALKTVALELQIPATLGPRARDWPVSRPAMIDLPGGSFVMGSPDDEAGRWNDEGPQRLVDVKPFRLAAHPVTNADLNGFLADHPDESQPPYWSDPRLNHPDQPAVGIDFDLALRIAAWAGGRLPSEGEWEYACRAATTTARYGDLDAVAWYGSNSCGRLRPVGTRLPNEFGLHDMLGNVWEWVSDHRHDDYVGAPLDARPWIDDPPSRPVRRLLRGGSWADDERTVRAATRLTDHPGPRIGNVGLRIAADV